MKVVANRWWFEIRYAYYAFRHWLYQDDSDIKFLFDLLLK